jgi:hypothetical protein
MTKHNDRVRLLAQAFTLWLLDMHSLPLMYTQSQGFRQVYREYYLRFTHDIQRAIINSLSIGDRRGDDNGKVTPYPTSSSMNEDEGDLETNLMEPFKDAEADLCIALLAYQREKGWRVK